MVFVEKVRAVFKHDTEGDAVKLPMLVNDDGIPEFTARKSTRFELVDAVVQIISLVSLDEYCRSGAGTR